MLPARALEWAITTDRTALLVPSKLCVVNDAPPVEAVQDSDARAGSLFRPP